MVQYILNKIRDLFRVKLYLIRSKTKKREREREKKRKKEKKCVRKRENRETSLTLILTGGS